MWTFLDSETWSFQEEAATGRPIAVQKATGKLSASSKSDHPLSPKAGRKEWSHNLHVSPARVHNTEAVFSTVREINRREHDDPTDDMDVNMALGSIFLNATLRAAGHLGQDHEANLRYVKNHLWSSVGQFSNETGKPISEQQEITGVSTVKFQDSTWMSTRLLCRKAYQISNAKAYFLSDPVLCGKMGDDPIATQKSKIKWYSESNHFKDMNRIDGMATEFEWKNFPGITKLGFFEKIQSLMRDIQCEREHFTDRIIFMSVFNDIAWTAEGNNEQCEYNSQTVAEHARRFHHGHWSFLRPGSDVKWYGTYTDKPDGSWDRMAEEMMLNFSDSGHPIFRASSAFERGGELRSKARGKKSIHFNSSYENIELPLRTVTSANQLSVHGAIADLCNELPKDLWAPGKPAAPANAQEGRNLVQEYERKFEQLSEDQKLSKLCSDAGLKLVETRQYFYTLDTEEGQQMQHSCREYTMPRNDEGTRVRGWIRKDTRIGPVLNIKVCYHDDRYSIEVQNPSLFEDNTASWVRIVNGVDTYVTESMLTEKEEDTASEKHIAKARPRQKPTVTLTSVSILVVERNWIDIETQRSHDHKFYELSHAMTRLLRHDQSVPPRSNGAIHYSAIIEECRRKK